MNKLEIENPEEILKQVNNLRTKTENINYLLFEYNSQDKLALTEKGNGGLDEIRPKFDTKRVQFGIVEVSVKGDQYNPIKYVLICWIGREVPAGLLKARSAGHRRELLDFIQTKMAIAMEFEASVSSDLDQKAMADKLTKTSNLYVVDKVDQNKQAFSRSSVQSGDTKLSQVTLIDSANFGKQVERAYSDKVLNWATMRYKAKDQIEFGDSGSGLDSLKQNFPQDTVVFAVYGQMVKETTTTVKKVLLITMVGASAPPLLKARSSPHREELLKYLKGMMPIHSQYQALSPSDLNEKDILEKLRAN